MSLSFLRTIPATAPIPDKINIPRPNVDSKLTFMTAYSSLMISESGNILKNTSESLKCFLVANPGIEPGTRGFSVLCSTD
jgi:hypothetical protein